jgi:DNA-binding PadR family transcriptional regulator
VPNRKKKTYILTEAGTRELEEVISQLEKVDDFIAALFNMDYWT